jgi:hypothetical protein
LLPLTAQLLEPETEPESVLPLVGAFQATVGAAKALAEKAMATAAVIFATCIASPFLDRFSLN